MADNDSTRLNPEGPEALLVGTRFQIRKCLGSGGMGDVFLAEDVSLHRLVAIKTVRSDLCKDVELRKRIERECLLHAKVGPHQHIVTLFDKFDVGEQINLVMEYVEGGTLESLLERHEREGTRLPLRDALTIAEQCLDALARIHAHGVIHRDIKPANIILGHEENGVVCAKLMDFGIARILEENEQTTKLTMIGSGGPGTPIYMSPEQIDPQSFGPVTSSTDIYSLGIMLYQMLTGRPPFTGNLATIFNGHLNAAPPPLHLAVEDSFANASGEMLNRALAKKTADRFASARDFREALLGLLGSATAESFVRVRTITTDPAADPKRTVLASNPTPVQSTDRGRTMLAGASTGGAGTTDRRGYQSARRKKWLAAVLVLLALGGGGAGWIIKGKSDDKASQPATVAAPMTAAVTPAVPATPAVGLTPDANPAKAPALAPPPAGMVPVPTVANAANPPALQIIQAPVSAPVVAAPAVDSSGGGAASAAFAARRSRVVARPSAPASDPPPGKASKSNDKSVDSVVAKKPDPDPTPDPDVSGKDSAPEPVNPVSPVAASEAKSRLKTLHFNTGKRREEYFNTPAADARSHDKNELYIQAEDYMKQGRKAENRGDVVAANDKYAKALLNYNKAMRDIQEKKKFTFK